MRNVTHDENVEKANQREKDRPCNQVLHAEGSVVMHTETTEVRGDDDETGDVGDRDADSKNLPQVLDRHSGRIRWRNGGRLGLLFLLIAHYGAYPPKGAGLAS